MDLAFYFTWFVEDPDNQQDGLVIESIGEFAPIIDFGEASLVVDSISMITAALLIADNTNLLGVGSESFIYFLPSQTNWVKWSDIGNLDFTNGLSNVAGERPMEWPGTVYKIKKLGNNIIAYGANGISLLFPRDTKFGLTNISMIGLKGSNAIAGTDLIHFYIDLTDDLYRFTDKVEKLGYKEYLAAMTNPILSYDSYSKLLYICDGVLGYVYNTQNESMGEGPVNITGIGYQDAFSYIASDGPVVIPAFNIWTDILDFGTRNAKTLHSIELGIDVAEDLWVSVEFRVNKQTNFIRLPWVIVNPSGVANIICHGVEFRIGIKTNVYNYFELDSIEIEGRIT